MPPLGIAVTVIEPGYFRTGFLNAGAKVLAQKKLDVYEGSVVGDVRKRLDETDNRQPGDVVKGAKVLVDILTRTGVAEGREVPVRVALGSDCVPAIRGKMEETEALLKEWEGVTTATDHDS